MIYILSKSKNSKYDFYVNVYNGYTGEKMSLHNTVANENEIDEAIRLGKLIKIGGEKYFRN